MVFTAQQYMTRYIQNGKSEDACHIIKKCVELDLLSALSAQWRLWSGDSS